MGLMAGEIKGTFKWLKNGADGGNVEGKDYVIKFGEEGISPIEAFILSVASCTAMDVVLILKKMRKLLEGLEIEIMGKEEKSILRRTLKYIFITKFVET